MLPFQKPLTLHEVALSTYPIGLQCRRCVRRTLLQAEDLGARLNDHRSLTEAGHRCRCGSTDFEVEHFATPSKARGWMRNV